MSWGLAVTSEENLGLKKELVLSKEIILKRVQELAQQISTDYDGKELVLVGILNGVVFFFADLVRRLTVPSKIDFIRAASYGSGMSTSGEVRFTKDLEMPITGRDVIRICALIDKQERREVEVKVDYCGFPVEKGFLVGYGLDYDEQYRYLPDIYALR
jgi:hypoxanthine phosphoribosyltransferase